MGSIVHMGSKPPVSCAYDPRPSPPTHISKLIFQKYTLPYPPLSEQYEHLTIIQPFQKVSAVHVCPKIMII